MKNLKKTVVLSLLAALFACSAIRAGETIKIGHNLVESHSIHQALLQFGKDIEQESQGRFVVQIFPNAVLGNDTAMIEQLQGGLLQFMKVAASFLDSFEDTYSILSIPYLFESPGHFYRVMDSDLVRPIYESSAGSDFLGLTYFTSGGRSFYTSSRPILKPADMAGMKIRVMPSPTSIEMVQLLGAHATPLPYGDVYTALQQGLLDGAENSEMALIDMKHGEVAKHYAYDIHTMIPDLLIVSAEFWNDLSDADKAMFERAAKKATKMQIELWDDGIEAAKKEASEKMGVEFHEVDKKPFQDAVRPILDQAMKNPAKAEIIKAIVAVR